MNVRKILALLVAMVMTLGCVGITAMAEENETVSSMAELAKALETANSTITASAVLTIAEGETYDLDMNGCTVNMGAYYIENNGTLTIKNGTVIADTFNEETNGAPLWNKGDMSVKDNVNVTGVCVAIRSQGNSTDIDTTGTIRVTGYNNYTCSLVRVKTGALAIKNGTFIGCHDATINGCSIVSPDSGTSTEITGGVFSNFSGQPQSIFASAAQDVVVVRGGTYTPAVTDGYTLAKVLETYLAEGYEVNENGVVGKIVAKIGEIGYTTVADAFAAAVDGNEVVINEAGTYSVPTGKDITITGAVEGVVFDNIGACNMGSANVTFNNVIFDYYPNVDYTGLQHSGNLIYNNCTINGQVFLYGISETFNECTFNQNSANAYNVWTYSAKAVNFNKCTFNSAGKSVLVYNEGVCATDLNVVDTDFIATQTVDGKAAIEIDTSLMPSGTEIVVDSATTATGFSENTNSGSNLWHDKKVDSTAINGGTTSVVIVAGETVKDSVENAPQGKLQLAYTNANYDNSGVSAICGEAINVVAKESFVVKLYSGETLVGTATLVDNDKVLLDGISKTITWHAALADDGDSWWSTKWEGGALNVNALPDTAVLWVDGVQIDTCNVELNIQDLEKPIVAAVTDEDGNVQSFVAGTGYLNGQGDNAAVYDEALRTAISAANAGKTIALLRDITISETVKVDFEGEITIDGNGHKITNSGATNSAVMLGSSGYGNDTYKATRKVILKDVVFDGWTTDHVVRVQGVTATIDGCEFINCNQTEGLGLLTFTYADATVSNCVFKNNNCVEVIDVNSWGDSSESSVTIKECTFENNTASGLYGLTGIIAAFYGDVSIENNDFVGNTAEINIIYTETNADVNDNYFYGNTLASDVEKKAVVMAGPWHDGNYTVNIKRNAFTDAYKGAYVEQFEKYPDAVTAYNLSSNYWNGGKPNYGTTGEPNVELNDYYTAYTDGTLSGLVSTATHVAQIGDVKYETLADALKNAQDGDTITLIWAEGDAPIAMNGAVYGNKTVTITGTATVDWSKGNLFVGRGGEGNGKVIFDNANLTSASNSSAYGIHVSGREKDTADKYDGTLIIQNSTIELDYLINKGTMTLDSSTLTVKNGFSIGGRPASETESGEDATATLTLNNNSKVIVNNHNGMGLGYEAIGVMNVNSGSTFECTQDFLITAKGTMNINGGNLIVDGKLTTNKNLFISGDSVIKIENLSGRATVLDDTTLTDSYIKSTANGTTRILGDLTLNGGFNAAYLMTAGSTTATTGYEGTITIEDDTTVNVSYGIEMNGNVTLNGGTIDLSGGDASGAIWGCVFQNGTFEINSDIVVDGGSDATPIHFTKATATVNGNITQSKTGGEPIYINAGSTVTFGDDAVITTDCSVHVSGTLKSSGDVYGTITKASDTAVIEISGGTYTQDVSDWCVDGFVATKNADGTYGVYKEPNATVAVLDPITLTAAEHDYMVWPSGDDTIDRPLEVVMNFKANDTVEESIAGGFNKWLVDFNLKFTGLTTGTITADNCYLAGNYGTLGWIVIPTDGLVLEEGVSYPVVAAYDATLNYNDICTSVKDFTAAIHVDPAILDANPNFKVELSLVMTNPDDANDKLVIGEPAVYTIEDLMGEEVLDTNTSYIRNIETKNDAGEDRYQVILFAGIDSLDYEAVGFEVTVDGVTRTQSTKTVYTSYVAAGVEYEASDWGENCEYIFALPINFATTYKDKSLEYRPFAVTLDGKTIWGKTGTIDKIYNKQ